ncbi:N-acetyltransferase [Nakamurella antarctica]|uniref:N-acetyltransferase n=1 Tax=Nakamurella antarctica TaxID=1902245 RepID=A0A3G8ZM17_9ACTN|nr:GNAT family N-acetyltransferase [Nakamurella antarctica]AZI57875.1 N-acetyltransferase [Nakamurella antarctica]
MKIVEISMLDLEAIAACGWQGTHTAHVGKWLLRAGSGFTGRANSVLPLGAADRPLDDALEVVDEFYSRAQLPPQFQLPFTAATPHPLAPSLIERGWRAEDLTNVLTTSIAGLPAVSGRPLPPAQFAAAPNHRWLSGYLYRGAPLPPGALAVLTRADSPVFLTLTDTVTDSLLAVARGIVTDGWLGITAVTVAAQHRRRGIASHVLTELAGWARQRGAHSVYLQVDAGNAAALALYRGAGFVVQHQYEYYRKSGSSV